MKITTVGAGYVGLSPGVVPAAAHEVTVLDIDPAKAAVINSHQPPISDPDITQTLVWT